jgi:hypothetical protein
MQQQHSQHLVQTLFWKFKMSNQGNVVVRYNNKEIILTSSRWGGPSVPLSVKNALVEVDDIEHYTKDLLWELIQNDLSPIFYIGNSDVPTVIIDLNNLTISYFVEHKQATLKVWFIDEFVNSDSQSISFPSEYL